MVEAFKQTLQQKGSAIVNTARESDNHDLAFNADELGFWNRVVSVYMTVLPGLEHDLQKAGNVSFFDYQVLDHLAAEDGVMTMSELASRCNSSLSRLSHVARKLEGRQLLVRRLSSEDKRVTVAEVTSDGRKLIERLREVYYEAVGSRVLQTLSSEEMRQATEILDNMLRRNQPDHWLFHSG